MKHLILIGLIALSGCNVDNATEESYSSDLHDPATGLTLLASEKMWVSFPEIVSIYVSTQACLGLSAPVGEGPDVEFKSFTTWYLGGAWGLYHPGGLVMVNTDEKDAYAGFPERSNTTDTEVLRHEFIHHILNVNNIPWHDGESSELFKRCGAGVTVAN